MILTKVRILFRHSAYLFWQFPLLWLPVLAADLSCYSLRHLQKAGTHRIAFHFLQQHSVFGSVSGFSESGLMKTSVFTLPLYWASVYLQILVYTLAIIATVKLTIERLPQLHARSSYPTMEWPASRHSLLFALKAMLVTAAIYIPMGVLSAWSISLRQSWLNLAQQSYLFAALATCLLAWLLMPVSLRLLGSSSTEPVSRENLLILRILAVAAVLATTAFAWLISIVESGTFIPRSLPLLATMISAAGSALSALPYAALFIAMGLVLGKGITASVDAQDHHAEVEQSQREDHPASTPTSEDI